jgi:SPX domain protein involved in polyphosphate accumulation
MQSATLSTAPSKALTEDFARYEFKYILNLAQRQAIEVEIGNFMGMDGHISEDLDDQYFVRSLYFDSARNGAFYEKIDGLKSRSKYRIRTYARTAAETAPVFLEQKGRFNERTYKHRVQIDRAHIPWFLTKGSYQAVLEAYSGIDVAENFVVEACRKGLEPKVLIDYLRRPYTSQFDMNFRVTFDGRVSATRSRMLFPPGSVGPERCIAGWSVMEVKFNRRFPAWFHRIIQAYDLRRVSVSKFVLGMKTCGLATDLS